MTWKTKAQARVTFSNGIPVIALRKSYAEFIFFLMKEHFNMRNVSKQVIVTIDHTIIWYLTVFLFSWLYEVHLELRIREKQNEK
jgi:hypothetical protein